MERTTTCMPCVPGILEGFRRGNTTSLGLDGRGGSGQNGGTDGGYGATVENEAGYFLNNTSNKHTGPPKMIASETKLTGGSDLPSVTRISTGTVGSSANRAYSLQKGKTSFGSAVDQDVVIEGVGIDNQHCYLINEGQVVTFYPLAVFNSIDGFRVTKPTKLHHGSVLCFGQSAYFRFNFPPAPKILLIKGSSPGDESRRKLIRLQSKPSAQEVNVTKSSFPVPDASQFYWVDFDKELGLKPSAPIRLTTSDDIGRLTDPRNASQWNACNVRHARNSLPSSSPSYHCWNARPSRVRIPGQDLEIYPKEKSECASPSTTFPSSPPDFSHDAKNGTKDVGGFARPSTNANECRQLDDKSKPGAPRLTEISSSSSSQNGGMTLSIVSRRSLNSSVRDDGEPCKTGPRVFPAELRCASTESSFPAISTVTCSYSGSSSSLHLSSHAYDDYDNVDDMRAVAIVSAAARLTNPPSAVVRNFQLLSNGPKSVQSSVVSESDSLSHGAPQMVLKCSSSLESGDGVCDPSIGLIGGNPQDQLSVSSSETCTKELIDCNWQSSDLEEVLCEIENSLSSASVRESVSEASSANIESADVAVPSSKNLDSVVTDLSSTSKLGDTFGSVEPSNSAEEDAELSREQCEDLSIIKAESSIITEGNSNSFDSISEFPLTRECAVTGICSEEPPAVTPHVDTESMQSSDSSKYAKFVAKEPEDLPFLMAESSITEENSAILITRSPFVEECGRTNGVHSNKPPIGKPVPESSKPVKTERKGIESDKKSPESATVSLFKSLLSRSWNSPLQKGRTNHPTGSSSTNDLKDHRLNQTSQLQTEEVKAVHHHSDLGTLAHDFDKGLKTCIEDGNISNFAGAGTLGGSVPSELPALHNDLPASSQNPWRFNLRDSLKLNLKNFKGEKVFTKDTVTTSVFVGVGSDRSHVCQTTPTSSCESHLKGHNDAHAKAAKALSSGITSSDQDLRSIAPLEPQVHSSVDYGYMSDSGISVVEDAGRIVRFCRPRGKKSVTFAAERCREGSLTQVPSGGQSPCETPQDLDCVAEVRSPIEKTSVSENVRTYLEVVDSSWQKGRPADNSSDLSSKDWTNGTEIQNGTLSLEAKDINKSKSKVIASNELFCSSPVLNSGSQNGPDVVEPHDAGKVKVVDDTQSVDFDDFGESQRDLRRLYEQQRASRLEDQRRAEIEKKRLEEILKMCSEFGVGSEFEKAKSREKKSNGACRESLNRGTSNSKDVVKQSAVKPCQRSDGTLTLPIGPQLPDHSLPAKFESNSNSGLTVSQNAINQTIKTDLGSASSIAFGVIDVNVTDRPFALLRSKERSSSLKECRPSESHRPSLDQVHLEGRRPSDECRSASRNTSHRGLTNGKLKELQLDWLPELQRDGRTAPDITQKISDPGTRQKKVSRKGEGKRALLEHKQHIPMEQLDRIREKIISLEMKEASFLAKAASQRSMDMEKIRLGREKLFDMEQRLKATEELTSRSTDADETETLKQQCSRMQKALHHLRFLVDSLEFQQLEMEACFEDEKELISKEVTSQHAYLSSLSNQLQNCWPSPRVPEGEVRTISRSLRFSPQKNPAKLSHTIPKIDSQRIRPGGEAFYNEEGRLSHELRKQSPSWPGWERSCDPPDEGVVNGALVQRQGPRSSAPTGNSGSEDSSVTGSEPLSEKTLSLSSQEDQFQDVERLLALAQSKGLRLIEEQMHQCDVKKEALEQERRCRKELECRLAEEITKNSDVVGQAIRLQEKERLQARPLTRYLPVHSHGLDLRQFVVAAGHSVDRCMHLAVTSTSCHGYLMKMGGRIRTWKKRWFVFDRAKHCLSYYGDRSESRPRGIVYFQSIEDVFVDHLHRVKSPTPQLTFCVKTSGRMYYLLASSPDAMRIWIDVIFTGAEGYQQFA